MFTADVYLDSNLWGPIVAIEILLTGTIINHEKSWHLMSCGMEVVPGMSLPVPADRILLVPEPMQGARHSKPP